MGIVLLVILILLLCGGVRSDWGNGPNGVIGLLLVVILVLLIIGLLPWGW